MINSKKLYKWKTIDYKCKQKNVKYKLFFVIKLWKPM